MCNERRKPAYNKNLGKLENFLVENKILANQLSLHHGHITVNVEVVDFDDDEKYQMGVRLLRKTYDDLSRREMFRGKLVYHDDVDEIEIIV